MSDAQNTKQQTMPLAALLESVGDPTRVDPCSIVLTDGSGDAADDTGHPDADDDAA